MVKQPSIRRTFTLLFIFAAGVVHAQDLTGVWQGHFNSTSMSTRSSLLDDRYKFEVQIAQRGKNVEAVTYSYLSSIFYGKAAATGAVNVKNGKLLLQEVKLLEIRNLMGGVCIMTCFLQYSKVGDEEFLEGKFVSMNVHDSSNCGRGAVFLRKTRFSYFYKEPFLVQREKELEEIKPAPKGPATAATPPKPPVKEGSTAARSSKPAPKTPVHAPTLPPAGNATATLRSPKPAAKAPGSKEKAQTDAQKADTRLTNKEAKTAPLPRSNMPAITQPHKGSDSLAGVGRNFPVITPRVLLSRSNVLVRTITVHSNELELKIYDDGAIDHDTVSVYLDKKQVIDHAMLTDRPLVLTLHLDESEDYHELVMVAENEGEIPPNTSLMIVKAGDKEYEVRITSTEQKNAMVIFKFEKK